MLYGKPEAYHARTSRGVAGTVRSAGAWSPPSVPRRAGRAPGSALGYGSASPDQVQPCLFSDESRRGGSKTEQSLSTLIRVRLPLLITEWPPEESWAALGPQLSPVALCYSHSGLVTG